MKKKKGHKGQHAHHAHKGPKDTKNGARGLISDLEDLKVTDNEAKETGNSEQASSSTTARLNGNCNGDHAENAPSAAAEKVDDKSSRSLPVSNSSSQRPSSPPPSSQSQSGRTSIGPVTLRALCQLCLSLPDQKPSPASAVTPTANEAANSRQAENDHEVGGATTEVAASPAEGDMATAPISYVVYESELQMPDIMRLIQKDLSEPYSIYTYRYFIHNWPHLCFMVRQKAKRGKTSVKHILSLSQS